MLKDRKSLLLYAITDRKWLNGRALEDVTEDVLKAGATFLQLREKRLTGGEKKEEALRVQRVAKKYQVPFVIDDDVALVKEIDADGVHVGQSDMEYTEARRILGPDKIIGVSAGTLEEAKEAERVGADYIGVGAVFPTTTKEDATCVTPAQFREICDSVRIPVVAIGGITPENAYQLAGTGIDGICVISAIYGAPDPAEATRALRKAAEEVVK